VKTSLITTTSCLNNIMTERITKRDLARRKAFADATAGVIGSLVSMLAFYPVDVWKTNIQAGVSNEESCVEANGSFSDRKSLTLQRVYELLPQLFRGLPHKFMHTTVSSFTYFFVYSLVQSKYATYRRSLASKRGNSSNDVKKGTSTITKLLLTAFSAVINTAITLPLDTISSRIQAGTTDKSKEGAASRGAAAKPATTLSNINNVIANKQSGLNGTSRRGSRSSISEDEEYHSANEEEIDDDLAGKKHQTMQQLYIKNPEKFRFSFSTDLREEAFASNTIVLRSEETNIRHRLCSISSLWNGLLPAILLCSNPAIQYTMYDTLKSTLLQRRPTHSSNEQQHLAKQSTSLSMRESFIVGLVSKFFATITTYPLIRAKVLLMVSPPDMLHDKPSAAAKKSTAVCTENTSNENSFRTHRQGTGVIESNNPPRSLSLLLLYIFKKNGIRGIYQGCSLQLLHTVLKSALLMMVREKITYGTMCFFQVQDE
jgi:hypothetical protein